MPNEERGAGWTFETLKQHIDSRVDALEKSFSDSTAALKETFVNSLAEAEKRNGQRFDAQQMGVKTAMEAAEKAVITAMAAAEKAVMKAETAADKRLDALNELRQMAMDWKTEFARVVEVNLQIKGLSEKIDSFQSSLSDKIEAIQSKSSATNTAQVAGVARGAGRDDMWKYATVAAGIVISTLMLALVFYKK